MRFLFFRLFNLLKKSGEHFEPRILHITFIQKVNLMSPAAKAYLIERKFVGSKFCCAKLIAGRNFRHKTKNSTFLPEEKCRPLEFKVSLVKVKVNLREKQVIQINYVYLVGRNFLRAKFSSLLDFSGQSFTR